jgi:hypothetical protein
MRRTRFRPGIDGTILEYRILLSMTQQPPHVDPMKPVSLPDPGDSGTPPGDYNPTNPGLC